MKNIDQLLENKAKTDQAIADYANTLRETLRRLEGTETTENRRQKRVCNSIDYGQSIVVGICSRLRSVVCKLSLPSTVRRLFPLLLILFGVVIGYGIHHPFFVTPDKPPVVQPETESLEDFVAREAERLLTAEERTKLIAVSEMILGQHFTRPSAIEEEFRLQRRLAGINSPAFNAFVDEWSAKVEEMHLEDSVESMREIYRSLLQGLQEVKARVDYSDEPVEVFVQSFPSNIPSETATEDVPDSSELLPSPPIPEVEAKPPPVGKQRPAIPRQRLFR